jgi:hypothetical protein
MQLKFSRVINGSTQQAHITVIFPINVGIGEGDVNVT